MEKPLRVLHIVKSLDIGGIESLALDFCNNAKNHNIEMHIVCIGGGELEQQFERSPAVFNTFRKIPRPNDLVDPFLVLKLRRYIVKNKIDVVHAHFADEGLHAYFATLGLKKPLLVQTFAVDFRINRKIDNRKFRFLSKKAGLTVSPSATLLNQAGQFGMNRKQNGHFVHNGIDRHRITGNAAPRLREELNLPQNVVLAGMVGNFYNEVRDQLTVCKALALVMKDFPGFHFVFAGGYQNQWIKKNHQRYEACKAVCDEAGITERVHFIGLRNDLPNIFGSFDFYVHATNYDTFGIAPVEAMFNGLAVIGNDAPVFREVSGNGKGMMLFKDNDEMDLARKIGQLIDDEQMRKSLGAQHHEFANTHYTIDHHIQQMKALYLSTVEN